MRSIFVRVEPTVRLVTGAKEVELLIVLHLYFVRGVSLFADGLSVHYFYFSGLIFHYCFMQTYICEIRPERIGHYQFGIRDLP